MKLLTGLAACLLTSGALAADDADMQQLRDELAELQARLTQLEQQPAQPQAQSSRLRFGAYADIHYGHIQNVDDFIDVDRAGLLFNYQYNSRVSANVQLELQHALTRENLPIGDESGELRLLEARADFLLGDHYRVTGGLFLLPIGRLNEMHLPADFYGVERNQVETQIIPTTWSEAGIAFNGQYQNGLAWDFAFHSGFNLPLQGNEAYLIRAGRQFVGEAISNSGAATARLRYTGLPGLDSAVSVQHQFDPTQDFDSEDSNISAWLYTGNLRYEWRSLGFTGLYAHWQLYGGPPAEDNGGGPDADGDGFSDPDGIRDGRDKQNGFYLQADWKVSHSVGLFGRYSEWDNGAGNPDADTDWLRWDIGLNWWPHPQVVIKMDIFTSEQTASNDLHGFNLGFGWQFDD